MAMKKSILSFALTFLMIVVCDSSVYAQTISIAAARALPVGSIVTVNGTVTSGTEFGTIRYIQDGTGGIGLFSTALTSLQRGDNVTVTGSTAQFQNLLEITTVTSWTLNSTGNPLPTPLPVTPSQLGESNESMLVRISGVSFISSGTFTANTTYPFNTASTPNMERNIKCCPVIPTTWWLPEHYQLPNNPIHKI